MANNSKEEPKTAPQSDRWYNLTLGPSFKDDSSNKYCTLRYEFKPASIDKTKVGSLHKNKENRVSLEFQNNQLGKPNVTFEGSSEDYKENDAVLFFDGQTFRLERLHRAVKQLRHLRKGESASAAALPGPAAEPRLSPVPKGAKPMHMGQGSLPPVPVEVERIHIGEPDNQGAKLPGKGIADPFDQSCVSTGSPSPKNDEAEDQREIDINDLFGAGTPEDENPAEQKIDVGFDVNKPRQNDTDDEIADVDDSGDEADKGRNAAEALRAQVNAEEGDEQTSSSSSSNGSGSSGSGSGSGSSSSSDREGSDDVSINSI
ncbi:EAF domain-containing protein [Cephalotus follicularis]|uniref:EAF domain-containing protein n=1 Tax=Cephalotus follicularis TaxID=3775 RepID=A0A1Q3CI86_CEPFO|nr:EAF domain-containing protein [Cephalotus follicularis]